MSGYGYGGGAGYFRAPVQNRGGYGQPFFGNQARGQSGLSGLFPGSSRAASFGSPIMTPPPRFTHPYSRPPSGALINALRNPNTVGAGTTNTAPTAAGVNQYNITTDPAYQQAQALVGLSNEQAQAAAQKQIRDSLLSYGDPGLIDKVLGAGGSDLAKAASANPNSTTAQLRTQRDRNLQTLDDQLNSANLSYSGYRVKQETQAAQDYQNALAQAAAQEMSQIGSIQDALNQAMQANNWQLYQAAQAAGAGQTVPQQPTGSAAAGQSSLAGWVSQMLGGVG